MIVPMAARATFNFPSSHAQLISPHIAKNTLHYCTAPNLGHGPNTGACPHHIGRAQRRRCYPKGGVALPYSVSPSTVACILPFPLAVALLSLPRHQFTSSLSEPRDFGYSLVALDGQRLDLLRHGVVGVDGIIGVVGIVISAALAGASRSLR